MMSAGRKRKRQSKSHAKQLWKRLLGLDVVDFATTEQIKKIMAIIENTPNTSNHFQKAVSTQLQEHPLRLNIIIWLEFYDPETYDCEAVEKIAEAYLSGILK